jgi:hypothetical protein
MFFHRVAGKEKAIDTSRSRTPGPLGLAPRAVLLPVAVALAALALAILAALEPARATLPGKNGTIAFAGGAHQIFAVSPSGDHLRQFTFGKTLKGSPAWSADGKRIAFVKDRGGPRQGDIYTMRTDGPEQAVITRNREDDSTPSWSPDGTRMVFGNPLTGLHTLDADGQDLRTIIGVSAEQPSWRPVVR